MSHPFFLIESPSKSSQICLLGRKWCSPIIIASYLTEEQEDDLLSVLKKHKEPIGWTMVDIKGLSQSIIQHRIHLIEDTTPNQDLQRRLSPIMQEVVPTEIIKL